MSNDTVDDLHQAEDFAGLAVTRLEELVAAIEVPLMIVQGDATQLNEAIANARAVIASWSTYCRPTCNAEGNPITAVETCEEDDCCGCPCGHADADPDDFVKCQNCGHAIHNEGASPEDPLWLHTQTGLGECEPGEPFGPGACPPEEEDEADAAG